jgi:pimeloyl-ACP methyl ester carboxylesterase
LSTGGEYEREGRSSPGKTGGKVERAEAIASSVVSRDGTRIAYDRVGHGPVVIIVEGALGSRSAWAQPSLASLLAPKFTAVTYDRRGRGNSTDTVPYSPEREVEDIDALLDELGGSACLYGISSGAALALRAASELGRKIGRLAIYDVAYDSDPGGREAWREYNEQLTSRLASGRKGDAVALFMKFVGVPSPQIDGIRGSPAWPALEALAPTLAYDAAVLGEDRSVPTDLVAKLITPTLVMYGGTSPHLMGDTAHSIAGAIPHAELCLVEGQGHDVRPEALAPVLTEFFLGM